MPVAILITVIGCAPCWFGTLVLHTCHPFVMYKKIHMGLELWDLILGPHYCRIPHSKPIMTDLEKNEDFKWCLLPLGIMYFWGIKLNKISKCPNLVISLACRQHRWEGILRANFITSICLSSAYKRNLGQHWQIRLLKRTRYRLKIRTLRRETCVTPAEKFLWNWSSHRR